MARLQFQPQFHFWQRAALAVAATFCMHAAQAQEKAAPAAAPAPAMAAPAPAAAAMPAPAVSAAPAPAAQAAAPKKRRVARRGGAGCTKLDDPWDNLCAIQKKAEVACADLPNGKRAVRRKGAPPPVIGNPRQECVSAYMRNV